MRLRAFTIVELLLIFFAIVIVSAVIIPLNMTDASQARRVAKWHKVFSELEYSFSILKLNDGFIFGEEPQKMSQGEMFERVIPVLNIADESKQKGFDKYKYSYRNKTYVKRSSRYYFSDFFMMNGNVIGSVKKNNEAGNDGPYAYMFVDVNGFQKPNRVGLDIFFINIFNDKITAYGEGYPFPDLKAGCSKIGKGLFCSKYYLVGSNL